MMTDQPIPRYRTNAFHRTYLKITALVIGAFGPIFFLGTMPSTAGPARWTIDLVSWPLDGAQDVSDPATRLLLALTGGFLLGWAVMVWLLSTRLYDQAPETVRQIVLTGILVWFIVDSTGSVTSGHASNVLFNLVFLLVGVGPLWWRALD
jgi:hypothetical protein